MQWSYWLIFGLLTLLSFLYYAPLYHKDFNSDHAVHVLMAERMEWPREVFYWGQARLGSLLPLAANWLVTTFGFHALWAISFVNHFFLLTFILVFSRYFKTLWYKLAFAFVILFPLYTYNAVLLVGHPYSSQLFSIALSWIGFEGLMRTLREDAEIKYREVQNVLFLLLMIGGVFLAVWVSEFSAILIPVYIAMIFLRADSRRSLIDLVKKRPYYFSILTAVTVICSYIAYLEFSYYKKIYATFKYYKMVNVDDTSYENFFLENSVQLNQHFQWFLEKATPVLKFEPENFSYSVFYYSLMAAFIFLAGYFIRNFKKYKSEKNLAIAASLLIFTLIGTVLLFYSTWNYRSQFAPRYFTLLYVLFLLALFLLGDLMKSRAKYVSGFFVLLMIYAVYHNNSLVLEKPYQGVYNEYKELENLPEGVLIGAYWQTYKLGAVSPHTLWAIAHDKDFVRNDFNVPDALNTTNVYLIKNDFILEEKMPDSMMQFGKMLYRTGSEIKISDVVLAPYRWAK